MRTRKYGHSLLLCIILSTLVAARQAPGELTNAHVIYESGDDGLQNGWEMSGLGYDATIEGNSLVVHVERDGEFSLLGGCPSLSDQSCEAILEIISLDCGFQRSLFFVEEDVTGMKSEPVRARDTENTFDPMTGFCRIQLNLTDAFEWDRIVFKDISGTGYSTRIYSISILSLKEQKIDLKETVGGKVPLYWPSSADIPLKSLESFSNRLVIGQLFPSASRQDLESFCLELEEQGGGRCRANSGGFVDSSWPFVTINVSTLTSLEAMRSSLVKTIQLFEVDTDVQLQQVDTVLSSSCQFVPWNLDRIDQKFLPLDGAFRANATGSGVLLYILDTGIRRTHREFTNRIEDGADCITPALESLMTGSFDISCMASPNTADDNGHGTHISGIAAGSCYGVAKGAQIVPIKIIGSSGSGSVSTLIAGLEWAYDDLQRRTRQLGYQPPAVVSMSVGSKDSIAIDSAVERMQKELNVTIVAASGNEFRGDACFNSPSRVPETLVISATNIGDLPAEFSNVGQCVDFWAPGEMILSASNQDDNSTAVFSGTSQAAPIASGIIALLLEQDPNLTPAEVRAILKKEAVQIQDLSSSTNAMPGQPTTTDLIQVPTGLLR